MLNKLICPTGNNKSRFHDEKNNFISWRNLVFNGPLALCTALLRVVFGYRPQAPWISYEAIEILKNILRRESQVLEFGSGMSTAWYAERSGFVCAVEDFHPWYAKVSNMLINKGLANVNYQFAKDKSEYTTFMSEDVILFDLIVIDGSYRSDCASAALKKINPGGIIYLDNSDKDSGPQGGDMRKAEEILLKFAASVNAEVDYFVDFAPAQFHVQQGMLVRMPLSTRSILAK